MNLRGAVTRFGHDINTDVIIAGQYLRSDDPEIWTKHLFETLDPGLAEKIRSTPILIGGKNFGCGSSREQAVLALKGAGVRAIVAESFAAIFYRNCVNNGVFPLKATGLATFPVVDGEEIQIDLAGAKVFSATHSVALEPVAPLVTRLVTEGGLLACYERAGRIEL